MVVDACRCPSDQMLSSFEIRQADWQMRQWRGDTKMLPANFRQTCSEPARCPSLGIHYVDSELILLKEYRNNPELIQ